MPDLDVSFMTSDPMLSDTFSVLRRTDAVDAKGRTTPTAEETFRDLVGVITWEDPADLVRLEQGQFVPRVMFIATTFALRGSTEGFQPDVIIYGCEQYVIKQVKPYSRFGQGTYEAVAESMTAMDQPIDNSD